MQETQPTFTPPTIDSQYRHIHPSNIPRERLEEMKYQIAESGVYIGKVTDFSGLTGAVEIIESEYDGGLLKVMPDVIMVPRDHPSRAQEAPPYSTLLLRHARPDNSRELHLAQNEISRANRKARQEVAELETTHADLADFLQTFVTAADESDLGYGYGADYQLIDYKGSHLHCKIVDPITNGGASYALLRIDMMHYRRPAAADESYTVVNMETGDEIGFAYSDVDRVRRGEYATGNEKGDVRVLQPRTIAEVAGLVDAHGFNDPLISLRQPGIPLTAELTTNDQVKRLESLMSVGDALYENTRFTFSPATTDELMAFLTQFGSDKVANIINIGTLPEGTASIIVDKEHKYGLDSLLETVAKFDEETQVSIYQKVDAVRVDLPGDGWGRSYAIDKIVRAAVQIKNDGTFITTPAVELLKRLECNHLDFLETIYKLAGGMYLESFSKKWDEKTTTRNVNERLNEQLARVYAGIFEWQLMQTADIARGSLHIPEDIEPADQIVMLLKNHGYTQKGMRLVEKETTRSRSDISVFEWAEICMIIDRCRDAKSITPEDQATIEGYGLVAASIAHQWKIAPGAWTEHIAERLVRPLDLGIL